MFNSLKRKTQSESADESQLLMRHINGDAKAFGELMNLYRKPIYSYLVRAGLDSATRDELFSDIFLKIHNGANSYQPKKPLKSWIFTIAANTVRSHYRKAKVDKLFNTSEKLDGAVAHGSDALQTLEASQTASFLEAEIQKLPLKQREVLILHSIENLSLNEISRVLEMPLNTVKTQLRRARETLAKAVQRQTLAGGEGL